MLVLCICTAFQLLTETHTYWLLEEASFSRFHKELSWALSRSLKSECLRGYWRRRRTSLLWQCSGACCSTREGARGWMMSSSHGSINLKHPWFKYMLQRPKSLWRQQWLILILIVLAVCRQHQYSVQSFKAHACVCPDVLIHCCFCRTLCSLFMNVHWTVCCYTEMCRHVCLSFLCCHKRINTLCCRKRHLFVLCM